MTDQIGSGTAQGAIDYLSSLVNKGRSREGVVRPLKIALTKILEKVAGVEDWKKVNVLELDLDDAMRRFKNLTMGTYTDASYRAYYLRAQRAIAWYSNFLENPGWVPEHSDRSKNTASRKNVATLAASAEETHENHRQDEQVRKASQSSAARFESVEVDMLTYPFPLQGGRLARLYFPTSITKADAKRLSAFIEALIVEEGDV